MAMTDDLQAGAVNCVTDCGGIRAGQSLYVVSQRGAVEEAVVAAIAAAGELAGGRVTLVWDDPIPKDSPDAIPPAVLAAYRDADVLVSHYPSLKRESLVPHFGGETRVRVPNRARTAAMLASDWARFPYGLQRAIAGRLDALMSPGKDWRITSPAGTDVSGTFGEAGGKVGAAFFVDAGEEGRARRNFPGGVHSPRTCAAMEGVIVCDYLDNVAMAPDDPPLEIGLAGGAVRSVRGGDAAGGARAAVEASDGFIDSWHAGVHPRTLVPVARRDNARSWFSYSHCSPEILHFHLGRSYDTTNVAVFGQTLDVAGTVLYRDGRLMTGADDVIAEAVARAGIPAGMLETRAVAAWPVEAAAQR